MLPRQKPHPPIRLSAMRSIALLGKEVMPAIKAHQLRSDETQVAWEHHS
jgi:hypothetical protein